MNLPTKITVARIVLVPVIIALFCLREVFEYYYLLMTLLYVITSSTDAIDGYLARKNNMVTDLGKFLDPIADKILVVAGLVILLDMSFTVPSTGELFSVMPPYFGVIGVISILAREFIIGVFRQMAAAKGIVMGADTLGKAKTVVTLIFIPMLMLVPLINVDNVIFKWVGVIFLFAGWVLFAVATILTILSGVNYILTNKQVLAEIKEDNNQASGVNEDIAFADKESDSEVCACDNIEEEANCSDKE